MTAFLSNTFSFNMVGDELSASFDLLVTPVDEDAVRAFLLEEVDVVVSMPNAATAALFSELVGFPTLPERNDINLKVGDSIVVFQYNGPRLVDGMRSLPKGGRARFFLVDVVEAEFPTEVAPKVA